MTHHDDPRSDETSADSPYADPAASFVRRDDNDDLIPVDRRVDHVGMCRIKPMVYGAAERYFGDAGAVTSIGPDVMAEIIRRHVVEPDYNAYCKREFGERGLTGRVVKEEMPAFVPVSLLEAVMQASGWDSAAVEMDQSTGEATVQFQTQPGEGAAEGN